MGCSDHHEMSLSGKFNFANAAAPNVVFGLQTTPHERSSLMLRSRPATSRGRSIATWLVAHRRLLVAHQSAAAIAPYFCGAAMRASSCTADAATYPR